MKKERRSAPRRRLGVETVFVMDRCSEKKAAVIDISAEGMQMRYSPENLICHQWSLIDIFADDRERLLISNLACRPVYDVASLMENESFSGAAVRTCGVCFEKITDEQRTGLNQLIESIDTAWPSDVDG